MSKVTRTDPTFTISDLSLREAQRLVALLGNTANLYDVWLELRKHPELRYEVRHVDGHRVFPDGTEISRLAIYARTGDRASGPGE